MKKIATSIAIALAVSMSAWGDEPITAPRILVGNNPVTGHSIKDGVVVSRSMLGATDAHAFTDKTIMDKVTDAGTYGAFDSVVELRGANRQNHIYSFQDRINYAGTNVLESTGGFLSRPVHSGTGEILIRTAVDIADVSVTGGGTVDKNVGIFIRNLASGKTNTALVMSQSRGYGLYSSGVAPSYHRSDMLFGVGSGPVLLDNPAQSDTPRDLSEAERSVAKQLKGMIKASRSKTTGKIGVGIPIADIRSAFAAQGLNADDYSIVEKTAQGPGVRYEQLLAFVLSAI